MADIGSAEWVAQCQQRANQLKVATDLTVTIEHRMTNNDDRHDHDHRNDDIIIWHVQINAGVVSYCTGAHPHPTLTLSGSRSTIEAICEGKQSAQRAFLDGTLTVVGDMSKLLESQVALEQVAAALMLATTVP